MKEKRSSGSSGGVGVLGVLLIVFIVLKMVGVVSWSWPIVLIPLWISLGLVVLALIVGVIAMMLAFADDSTPKHRPKKR